MTDSNWVFGPIEAGNASGYHGDYDSMIGGRNRLLLSWSDERGGDPDVYFSEQQARREHDTPDFNISAEKLFDSVIAGRATEYPVSTQGFHGFSGGLRLSASPSIAGVIYRFSNTRVRAGEAASLVIDTDQTAVPGTYLIRVTATGAGTERATNLRLTVYGADRVAGVPVNATDIRGFTESTITTMCS